METQNYPLPPNNQQGPPLPPASPAPPAPVPGPPAPPPSNTGTGESYESGGIIKQINWVQIGFLFLGAYTLYNVIDFYRKKALAQQQSQATVAELKQKQDNLETKFYGFVNQLKRRA